MSKPPKKVKIGPHLYKVILVPEGMLEAAGADGLCTPRHNKIALDEEQPHTAMADSLLHELIHGLLAGTKMEEDDEERLCRLLAPGFLGVLRDNPDLVTFLLK